MITGDIKNQIDRIWDSFWSGGISNPLEVIEQITYLLFLRRDVIPEFSSVMLWSPISTRGDRAHEEALFGRADHRISAGS